MTTPRAVATELDGVLTYLYERNVLYFYNTIREIPSRVTWNSSHPFEDFLLDRDRSTVEGYMHWLRSGMFSGLFRDGSLLQITYDFDGSRIVGHRLAYIPCPVEVDQSLLDEGLELPEAIEFTALEPKNLLMRSAIRFDYDPANAGPGHPSAHFTINSSDCRVACKSPLRLGRFLDFVFRHFYPTVHKSDAFIQGLTQTGWFKSTLADDELELAHLSWPA